MKIICLLLPCKREHISDIVVGFSNYDQPIRMGLYQCVRCKAISKGMCHSLTEEPVPKTTTKETKRR